MDAHKRHGLTRGTGREAEREKGKGKEWTRKMTNESARELDAIKGRRQRERERGHESRLDRDWDRDRHRDWWMEKEKEKDRGGDELAGVGRLRLRGLMVCFSHGPGFNRSGREEGVVVVVVVEGVSHRQTFRKINWVSINWNVKRKINDKIIFNDCNQLKNWN